MFRSLLSLRKTIEKYGAGGEIRTPDLRITNVSEENLPQSPESLESPESQEPNKTETPETEENSGDS